LVDRGDVHASDHGDVIGISKFPAGPAEFSDREASFVNGVELFADGGQAQV
jgi:hypothetical protein